MSGGVDSSVAAGLLIAAGRECLGLTMRLGLSGETASGDDEAVARAREVCARLGIEHRSVDLSSTFRARVLGPYAEAYGRGETPNPCVACNQHVKFGALAAEAVRLGCAALATGHYARVGRDADGAVFLRRGLDRAKDQSYFLYRVSPDALASVVFPVGDLAKEDVRARAEDMGLGGMVRPESREACFAADGDRTPALAATAPEALAPGPIVDESGSRVGTHEGIARYTVGQRHGLGGGSKDPRYVLRIEAEDNRLVVGSAQALAVSRVEAADVAWWLSEDTIDGEVQLRYRGAAHSARCTRSGDALVAELLDAARCAAPGQSLVCYKGERVCGGGRITVAS
jgi:tRNA-specific 2-thiouridylase